ncbi:MAG TPA: dienelactone hydrolase family protein [Phycisphaerae bacterium]|nr:dienelactone hydrolase family protein [Phycisphaerae bacterium]
MVQSSWIDLSTGKKAYYSRPEKPGNYPVVVIIYEVFGLNEHFQEVARKVAAAGFAAIVPDFMAGKIFSYSDVKSAMEVVKNITDDMLLADISASLDAAAGHPEAHASRAGILGFCLGGRAAFLAACKLSDKLKAAVCFYGGGISPSGPDRFGRQPPLTDANVAGITAPLLFIYGNLDTHIPPDEHARIVEALGKAKKQFTLATFPAGHGFASDRREMFHAPSAEAAWQMTFAHFNRYL